MKVHKRRIYQFASGSGVNARRNGRIHTSDSRNLGGLDDLLPLRFPTPLVDPVVLGFAGSVRQVVRLVTEHVVVALFPDLTAHIEGDKVLVEEWIPHLLSQSCYDSGRLEPSREHVLVQDARHQLQPHDLDLGFTGRQASERTSLCHVRGRRDIVTSGRCYFLLVWYCFWFKRPHWDCSKGSVACITSGVSTYLSGRDKQSLSPGAVSRWQCGAGCLTCMHGPHAGTKSWCYCSYRHNTETGLLGVARPALVAGTGPSIATNVRNTRIWPHTFHLRSSA